MNLDPFEQYTDAKLWEALEQTGLKTFVQTLKEGLEHMCSEGGENLRFVANLCFQVQLAGCDVALCHVCQFFFLMKI